MESAQIKTEKALSSLTCHICEPSISFESLDQLRAHLHGHFTHRGQKWQYRRILDDPEIFTHDDSEPQW
jgi:hypothetical protein